MTHAAAATRTLRSPAVGPIGRRRASAPVSGVVAPWVVALARTIVRGDDVIFSEEAS